MLEENIFSTEEKHVVKLEETSAESFFKCNSFLEKSQGSPCLKSLFFVSFTVAGFWGMSVFPAMEADYK